MPPAAPYQPQVMVVSDSEVALSWKPSMNQGSSPIQYYTVEFIRQVGQWRLDFSVCVLQGYFYLNCTIKLHVDSSNDLFIYCV